MGTATETPGCSVRNCSNERRAEAARCEKLTRFRSLISWTVALCLFIGEQSGATTLIQEHLAGVRAVRVFVSIKGLPNGEELEGEFKRVCSDIIEAGGLSTDSRDQDLLISIDILPFPGEEIDRELAALLSVSYREPASPLRAPSFEVGGAQTWGERTFFLARSEQLIEELLRRTRILVELFVDDIQTANSLRARKAADAEFGNKTLQLCSRVGFSYPLGAFFDVINRPFSVRAIRGRIMSEAGDPVGSPVLLELELLNAEEVLHVHVDSLGNFSLPDVSPGAYCFKASADGRKPILGIAVVNPEVGEMYRIDLSISEGE